MRWLRALLATLGTATLLAPCSADREWDILQLYHNTERPAGKTAEDFYGIGYSFQKQDDAQAAANYRWALDLQPGLFAANINLGNLLDTHGELEEAAEYYRRAAKAEPRAQLAVNNLGNTMNRMARHSEAVAALSTAVRLDPSNWQASLNLGNSLCAKGDLQSAVQLYQSVVRANPNDDNYAWRLAYFLLLSGDDAGAAKWARRAVTIQPAHGPALWTLGIATHGGLHQPASAERREPFAEPEPFAELAGLLREGGDENALKLELYRSLRDANLVKCPEWDPAASKEQLALNIRALNASHPGAGDFFPQTFVPSDPEDYAAYEAAARAAGPAAMWMQKPSGSKNGLGIKVFQGPQPTGRKRGLLIQRYVEPPYLVDGLKFNFRLYVACTDLDPLRLYIFHDAMMYFSGNKFVPDDITTMPSHISNRGYTDKPVAFPDSLEHLPDAAEVDRSTRTLEAFKRYLAGQGRDAEAFWREVKAVVLKTFVAFVPKLRSRWKKLVPEAGRRYFLPHLSGVDVHLDADLKPWLLEVNANPAMGARKRVRSKVMRSMWAMVTPGADRAVRWPGERRGEKEEADGWNDAPPRGDAVLASETMAALQAEGVLREHCPKGAPVAGPGACLPPALARKVVAGELEYAKRGRFERIWPTAEGTEAADAALALLPSKANQAAVHWDRWLREREASGRDEF